MPPLSLGYLSLPGASASELVHAAHAAGLQCAGVRIAGRKPEDVGNWPAHNTLALADLHRAMSETGVQVMNVSAHYLAEDTALQSYAPIFATAAALGARFVCLSSYDPDEDRLAARLTQLACTASDHGLRLALEFVPYSATRTLEAAARVVASVNASNVGVLLDALHFMRSGSRLQSLRELPREHLAFVQLCDGQATSPPPERLSEEARGGRLYPGEGTFPLREILAAVGTDVPLEIEVPHARMAGRPFDEQAATAAAAVQFYLQAARRGYGPPLRTAIPGSSPAGSTEVAA